MMSEITNKEGLRRLCRSPYAYVLVGLLAAILASIPLFEALSRRVPVGHVTRYWISVHVLLYSSFIVICLKTRSTTIWRQVALGIAVGYASGMTALAIDVLFPFDGAGRPSRSFLSVGTVTGLVLVPAVTFSWAVGGIMGLVIGFLRKRFCLVAGARSS